MLVLKGDNGARNVVGWTTVPEEKKDPRVENGDCVRLKDEDRNPG
jgi:hypothetical protein